MKSPELIPVSAPVRPPQDHLDDLFQGIWDRAWLTNDGPLCRRLESEISQYLQLPGIVATANGTLALQLLLRAWGCTSGEVITTPFTFIATATSAVWQGLKPIFADIDPQTWNIDPKEVKACITSETRAILATHVFGNPCDVEALQAIGDEAGVPVFYDAAHTFGVTYRERSLLTYGSASAISFHATKIFHTAEGGAVVMNTRAHLERLRKLRNFGYSFTSGSDGVGINAKMSEFHAAIGLALLPNFEEQLEERMQRWCYYVKQLTKIPKIQFQTIRDETRHNAAYAAVLLPDSKILQAVRERLKTRGYDSRRYFYPSLDTYSVFQSKRKMGISRDVAQRILALPLYPHLEYAHIDRICSILSDTLHSSHNSSPSR